MVAASEDQLYPRNSERCSVSFEADLDSIGCLHETCHVLWSYGRKSTQKIILFYAEQYDVRNINQSTIRFDCLNKGVEKPEDRKINMKVPVVFEELQLHDTNVKIMDPVVTEKTVKHKRRSIWSRIKTFFRRMLCNSIKLLKIKLLHTIKNCINKNKYINVTIYNITKSFFFGLPTLVQPKIAHALNRVIFVIGSIVIDR
ncbi:hypothetical protein QTP88_009183 [Uroleucon formosanum]